MDYKSATNPDTGEKVFLVNNEWVKPTQAATNPDTGAKAYLIGNEWHIPNAPPLTTTEQPKTESRIGEIVSDIGKSSLGLGATILSQVPETLFSREKKATEVSAAAPYEALKYLTGQKNILDTLRETYGGAPKQEEKPSIITKAEEMFAKPVQQAAEQTYLPGSKELAKIGSDFSQKINSTISPETRKQLEGSVPTFDIAKGELPSLGKAPTLLGYGMQFLNVLESQAPILAAALRGKNKIERIANAADMGQRLSTDEGMGDARSYIDSLSDEQLAKASPEFVELSKTMDPKKARGLVTDKAMLDAGVAQGVVGRFGAEITGHLLGGSFDKIALDTIKNKAARVAAMATAGGTEQGLEEAVEGLASDMGVNKHVAKEVGAGAFANLVFGALGGMTTGGYAGLKAKPKTEPAPPQYTQNEQGTFVPVNPPGATPKGTVTLEPLDLKQGQLDLQGGEGGAPQTTGFESEAGTGKYAAMAADRRPEKQQLATELRNQFDTLEQELSRLQAAYETEQDPAKKQAILVQAQKLDFARQEVESKIKTIPNLPERLSQPYAQGTLEFEPRTVPAPVSTEAQQDLFGEPLPYQVDPSALTVEQQKASEIERQIFALEQEPKTAKIKQQIEDLKAQLPKETGITEEDKTQRKLKEVSPIVGNAMSKFGLTPKAPIRNTIKNLDMTVPEDRATFIDEVNKHAIKGAKINMDEVEKYLSYFEETPNADRTSADNNRVNTGTTEPSLPVPNQGTAPTQGTTAPVSTGVESNIGSPVGVGTGTKTLQNVQPNTLTTQNQAPIVQPAQLGDESNTIEGEARVIPQNTQVAKQQAAPQIGQETQQAAPQTPNYGREINPNTAAALQQPNVTMGALPTSNVVEGQATVSPKQVEVQNDAVHDELTSKEQTQLAAIYGQDEYNDVAKARFIDDFIKAINEGLDKVHKVVANIVRRLQATVLATAIIMNPNYMSPSSIVLMPVQQQVTTTEQVKAEVPKEVKGMSDGAKKAYSTLMPALQDQGKYFTIVDKPSATVYVFNSDGSLVKQSKVLLGKAFGDFYKGGTDFVQNRITPAGNFVINAEKGGATYDGKTIYTVGNVDEGWSAAIFHTVYTKESDAKARLAALDKEGPEDSRYSHGCINGSPDLMEAINNEKMDKSHMFVVPDNPEMLDSFISNTVPNTDLTRATVEPKTVTKTTTTQGQGASTVGGQNQFAIRKEDSMVSAIKKLKKPNAFSSLTPSELEQARELFGEDDDKGIALLRSGFTLDDALKAIGLQKVKKVPTTPEGIEAQKNSEKFNVGFNPPPHKGRFAGIHRKLMAVKQGNLNIGSLIFGNAQNFASNTQAFVNLSRKINLDLEKSGVLTPEQAALSHFRMMGVQTTQRATLALQMMKQGLWKYNPINAWYDTKLDPNVNMDVYDAQIPLLAKRLGVDNETSLKHIDEALEASRLNEFFENQKRLKIEIAQSEKIKAGLEAIKDRTKTEDRELESERFILRKLKKDLDRYEKKAMHRTLENVTGGMAQLKYPEVQKAVAIWQEMRKRTIKEMVDSGTLTEEQAEDWLDEAAYVPFFRDLDLSTEKITPQQIFTRGLRESTAPLRAKQKGSMEELISPSTNMRQWMSWALASSVSNRQINNMIQQYKVWDPKGIVEGNDPKKSSFAVMENGEEKYYNVADADIAQAFMRQATYVFPLMAEIKAINDLGRKAITRNPIFSLSQIPMDLYAAMFTSGVNSQLGLLGNTVSEALKTPFNLSKIRKDMIASGVLNTHDWNALNDDDSIKIASKVKDPSFYAKAMHVLEKIGAYSDNVVRQGVAKQLMDEGKTREQAYSIATEIINFRNRSGMQSLNSLSQSTMFFNSWLQALAVTSKTLSGQGLGYQTRAAGMELLAKNFAKIAAFSFFWAVMQGSADDKDVYGRKSRRTRDRVFIIPRTEGMAIPIRQDIYAIPHFLGQDLYNVVMDKTYTDPKMVKESLKDAIGNTFMPPSFGVAQAIKVPAEIGLNKDFYTGQDIVPKYMETLEPYLQYNQSTSELAKSIGEATNTSPLKWDHALKGFTGSISSLLNLFTDSLISQEKGIEKPAESWRDTLSKLPSAGPILGNSKDMAVISDFYEVKKDVDRVVATYKKLASMDEKKAEEYLAKHEDELIKIKGIETGFSNLKKYENYILEAKIGTKFDDGMPVTPKTKADKIREIESYKKELKGSVKEVRKYVYKEF